MSSPKTSILRKILIPILFVMILQTGLLYGVVFFGGTASQLENNYFDIFNEKVSGRKSALENQMVEHLSNLNSASEELVTRTENFLKSNSYMLSDLQTNDELAAKFLREESSALIYLLRRNVATGAFLVLDSQDDSHKSGLYFRDSDPHSNPTDYSDLLAQRAPSLVTNQTHMALDSLWHPYFDLADKSATETSFFYKPLLAAREHPEIPASNLGYWSYPFYLNPNKPQDSSEIITCSMPLVYSDGTVYGVLGIELSTDYVAKMLSSKDLTTDGGYLLAIGNAEKKDGGGDYQAAVRNGALVTRLLRDTDKLTLKPYTKASFYTINTESSIHEKVYGCAHTLKLYNTHTPFINDQWTLIGVSKSESLLAFSNHFRLILAYSWISTLIIGLIGVFYVARRITRPIGFLARQLRHADPNEQIDLDQLGISEIDELSDSIMLLSRKVADSALRLSKILELTGVSMGAFEYVPAIFPDKVFCTNQLPSLLGNPNLNVDGGYVDAGEFKRLMDTLGYRLEPVDDSEALIYDMHQPDAQPCWVRLRLVRENSRVMGVFTDVTQDIIEKRKLEHERDFDLLTNTLNRRAFHANIKKLFSQPELLSVAALVMLDLDNLKFINDTYGHDYGDEYIRSAASALQRYSNPSAVVSRLSGDEFIVFLHGFPSKAALHLVLDQLQHGLQQTEMYLPDRSRVIIRASAGVAWYGQDSNNYEDLIRYADFAMYMVKHTNKGQFTEFSIESYNKESYLLHCREELNTLLDESLVDYQFQPIVDAISGEIYAFEALMRPMTDNIKTPDALLSLARSQSRLSDIERITFFRALECFIVQPIAQTDCRLFLNSVSNQLLSLAEMLRFEQIYAPYLHRIVIELTEEEKANETITRAKQDYAAKWGSCVALDDFGVGYNGESVLADLTPGFIKLDISIVRNIDTDENRQQIARNLISYSKQRGIRVIAEGVERTEELKTVIACGADYIQGYLLAIPSFQPVPYLDAEKVQLLLDVNRQIKAESEIASSESSGIANM